MQRCEASNVSTCRILLVVAQSRWVVWRGHFHDCDTNVGCAFCSVALDVTPLISPLHSCNARALTLCHSVRSSRCRCSSRNFFPNIFCNEALSSQKPLSFDQRHKCSFLYTLVLYTFTALDKALISVDVCIWCTNHFVVQLIKHFAPKTICSSFCAV